jgi:hypothetical protein
MLVGCDEGASWQSSKDNAHLAVVEAICAGTRDELAKAVGNVADAATGIPEVERKTRFEAEARAVTLSDCAEYQSHAEVANVTN